MPLPLSDCLLDCRTVSGKLAAYSFPHADRFGHAIWWTTDAGSPHLVMMSLEGKADDTWPISPPFQQLVCEKVGAGGKEVLLGVGMAGRSHWSATIEGDSMDEAIAFDCACRTSVVPTLLSSYLIDPNWQILPVDKDSLILTLADHTRLSLQTIGPCELRTEGTRVSLHPILGEHKTLVNRTYRWRYALRRHDANPELAVRPT